MAKSQATQKKGAVMVVGAGVAGMQASLDLASSGYFVHLIDKSPTIGGIMAQLDKTFPTNDCAMCIISPKLVEVGRHLNIQIHPNTEIETLEGEAGNFSITVKSQPRFIDLKACTACGQCRQVCPVSAANEFNQQLDLTGSHLHAVSAGHPARFHHRSQYLYRLRAVREGLSGRGGPL